MDACTNPDILRVIWFFRMIVNIVKIIIPIALIVLGIIDFSKAAITNDEKAQQKSGKLFGKRLLYAVLVFTIPWLVEVLMVTLGNLIGEDGQVNFTDCIENANGEAIEKLESNECAGKEFIFYYYNEDGSSKEEMAYGCTDKTFQFKLLSKPGYEFKGWASRTNPSEIIWTPKYQYVFYDEDIERINNELGGFNLVPVYKEITLEGCDPKAKHKIDFFDETGDNLINTIEFCEEQLVTFPTYNSGNRIFKGWGYKFDKMGNRVQGKIAPEYTAGQQRTFNSAQLAMHVYKVHWSFDLIPVFE